MKIGIISDTHDNIPNVLKAVDIFNSESVQLVLHAGDYVAPFSIKPLLNLKCEFYGVFGNNDGDKIALQNMSKGRVSSPVAIHNYDGKKILLGHFFDPLEALIQSQEFDLIIFGHTHEPMIKKVGDCIAVNPGECGGWLKGKSTIALADLAKKEAEIITLT